MTQKEFEKKYYHKWITYAGGDWELPMMDYYVTAALYHFDNETTSILGLAPMGNAPLITLHVTDDNLTKLDQYFVMNQTND